MNNVQHSDQLPPAGKCCCHGPQAQTFTTATQNVPSPRFRRSTRTDPPSRVKLEHAQALARIFILSFLFVGNVGIEPIREGMPNGHVKQPSVFYVGLHRCFWCLKKRQKPSVPLLILMSSQRPFLFGSLNFKEGELELEIKRDESNYTMSGILGKK